VLAAKQIFMNVGARAVVPKIPGLDQVPYLTNSSMMDVDFLPRHLIVLGGSYIGLEFAQMYRRVGSEGTGIRQGPPPVAREDADVSDAIAQILRDEGIDIRLGSTAARVEKRGSDIALDLEAAGATSQVVGSHLLLGIGRRPNTDDLGLDMAG